MNIKIKLMMSIVILSGSLALASPTVHFQFNNLENVSGKIYIVVINDADAWDDDKRPEEKIAFKAAVLVGEKNTSITVSGLKTGIYAAQIFHDLNNNGELDTNRLKIPKEPYGFSNNKKGVFGKPKFKNASFTVKDKDVIQKIKFF